MIDIGFPYHIFLTVREAYLKKFMVILGEK